MRAGASPASALLLALIVTHRNKRSIPGLLAYGPSGLAESLSGYSMSAVKRAFGELGRLGLISFDESARPPLLYVRGSVQADPPTSENAVKGMAKQIRELPPHSSLVKEVQEAISTVLSGSQWEAKWSEWSAVVGAGASGKGLVYEPSPDPGPEPAPSHEPNQPSGFGASGSQRREAVSSLNPGAGAVSIPLRKPVSESQSPASHPPSPEDVAGALNAWHRLASPPFAKTSEGEVTRALGLFSLSRFEELVKALGQSRWASGDYTKKPPPSLQRLCDDAEYREKVLANHHIASNLMWRCSSCGTGHRPLDECPAPCQGCGRRHLESEFCRQLLARNIQERGMSRPAIEI